MKSKLRKISPNPNRALVTDILPFEVPVIFSNHGFYEFCKANHLRLYDGVLSWKKGNVGLKHFILLLLGLPINTSVENRPTPKFTESYVKLEEKSVLAAKAFTFKIRHNENGFRDLSVSHPRTQLKLVEFYDSFKETIIYQCSKSSISLRKPVKVSSHTYFSDKLFLDRFDKSESEIELAEKEYDRLKSFFVYKEVSNIYKFYESNVFHNCEKRYNHLLKLDVSKCFDSIYTHSISWAIYGKEKVKKGFLTPKKNPIANTFSDKFDNLMQWMNSRETNGIIIGPEVSRIFAEIILQTIDVNVINSVKKKLSIENTKEEFKIYRYIDDYFVFYNEGHVRDTIVDELQKELKEYKLHLNDAKSKNYDKPIITEISIAKSKISSLLNKELCWEEYQNSSGEEKKRLSLYSKSMITSFKTIIKECDVEYKHVLNWTFAILESKLAEIFSVYVKMEAEDRSEKSAMLFLMNLVDFLFFIYSVTPRVNTTLRLCRILTQISLFQSKVSDKNLVHSLDRSIFENILFLLQKFKHKEITQVESLYLITQVSQLGSQYYLTEEQLFRYLDISLKNKNLDHEKFNYFAIFVLLSYIKNENHYPNLKQLLYDVIEDKLFGGRALKSWDTETNLILMDSLSCPYLTPKFKRRILRLSGVTSVTAIKQIIASKQSWFINWRSFDYKEALDSKKSLDVY